MLNLESPLAYQEPLGVLYEALRSGETRFVIDIGAVTFMNSSGITALARLVLEARELRRPVEIVASRSGGWQRKTLISLQRLYDGLSVSFPEDP